MQSKARTVKAYLAELTPERRAALQAVREVILENLGEGFEEGMSYGAIGYYVPHRLYPNGYHCDRKLPLPFAGLGWQKHHMSLGIMSTYADGSEEKWLRAEWAKSGHKLDMGKCCIRFKRIEDVPLDVIGAAFRRVNANDYIHLYESMMKPAKSGGGRPDKAARTVEKPAARAKPVRAAKRKTRAR